MVEHVEAIVVIPADYVDELASACEELISCAENRHSLIMRGRDARNLGCEDGTDLSTSDYTWERVIERCRAAIQTIKEYSE